MNEKDKITITVLENNINEFEKQLLKQKEITWDSTRSYKEKTKARAEIYIINLSLNNAKTKLLEIYKRLLEANTVSEYGLSYNTEYENELMADTSNYDGEWQPYKSNNKW